MEGSSVVVRVENGSGEPVYDFVAWVHHHYAADSAVTGPFERPGLLPGEHTIKVDGIGCRTVGWPAIRVWT